MNASIIHAQENMDKRQFVKYLLDEESADYHGEKRYKLFRKNPTQYYSTLNKTGKKDFKYGCWAFHQDHLWRSAHINQMLKKFKAKNIAKATAG